MKKSKLFAIMPVVCLLTLTSCGGETFTEVTDATAKETTLAAAKKENADQSSYISAQLEISYSGTINSTSLGGSAVIAAGFSSDSKYASLYTSMKADNNNYYQTAVVYSSADSTFYTIIDAKASTSSLNTSVKGKFALPTLSSSSYEASTDSAKNTLVESYLGNASIVDISSISSSSENLKIYTGSKGSTKIEFTSDEGNFSLIINSSGYLTNATSNVKSGTTDFTSTLAYSYNLKSVTSMNPSDYTTVTGTDATSLSFNSASIMVSVMASMGITTAVGA